MKKTTIGLVDDHKLLRNALASLINAFRDYEVIIEASNGRELCTCLERIQPDILILDFNMPEMNGYDTAEWLKLHYPDILVLMLTMYDTELMLIKMLQAGVRAVSY